MSASNRNNPETIRVCLVEDKDAFREHLAALLNGADGIACVGSHATAASALRHISAERPDVLVLDLELPDRAGDEVLPELKKKLSTVEILVLTLHDEPRRIFKALEAGASGYLVKPVSPVRLLDAIAEVRHGGSPMSSPIARLVVRTFQQRRQSNSNLERLTPREEETLQLLAEGHQTQEIADRLDISPRTVGNHLHHIYEKLHVVSRSQAVSKYFQR